MFTQMTLLHYIVHESSCYADCVLTGVNTTYYSNMTEFNTTQVPLIHNGSQAAINSSNISLHRTSPSDEFFR